MFAAVSGVQRDRYTSLLGGVPEQDSLPIRSKLIGVTVKEQKGWRVGPQVRYRIGKLHQLTAFTDGATEEQSGFGVGGVMLFADLRKVGRTANTDHSLDARAHTGPTTVTFKFRYVVRGA